MNRRLADRLAAIVVGGIVLLGGVWAWQRYEEQRALDRNVGGGMGSMMNGMGMNQGPDPIVLAIGTIIAAATVAGAYIVLRSELPAESPDGVRPAASRVTTQEANSQRDGAGSDGSAPDGESAPSAVRQTGSQRELLDFLPADERRVLEPVIESPGLTQVELRDRAEFSKSKVSQTISDLEQRGLVYRERQGRTYRVYPSDELPANQS